MSRVSPTLEGFRAAWRLPSLPLTEIAWRWTAGATALALLVFSFFEYLNTLSVNNAELLLLRSGQPILISRAIAHILRGSLARVSLAALFGTAALTLLWIVGASIGRAATLRLLLNYFSDRFTPESKTALAAPADSAAVSPSQQNDAHVAGDTSLESRKTSSRPFFSALIGLNFLRAAAAVAAIFAFVGAMILAGSASPDANPRPGTAFMLFLPLAVLIGFFWSILNWILSLAAIFAVSAEKDGADGSEGPLRAISGAVALCRDRFGALVAVGFWFGLAHTAVFMGTTTVASFCLGFRVVPGRVVLAVLFVTALLYFALVDWLYAARLAGDVCIAEMPDALFALASIPTPPSAGGQFAPSAPPATTIDRDEPILSDVPPRWHINIVGT